MNIALVGTLDATPLVDGDGQVDLPLIRAVVAAHLDRAPMLRRVLQRTHLGQGRAVWIDDGNFRIDQHVVLARFDHPVTDQQMFLDWCAAETLRRLDRSKPLWRITVVPGLPNGRLGLLVVVHHVVADGLRGVAMIAGLLDADPAVGDAIPQSSWRPGKPPTSRQLVIDNLRERAAAVASFRPGRLRDRRVGLRGLLSEVFGQAASATVLSGRIGSGRHLVVIRESVDPLKAAAHRLGCTLNDLLLAAVAQGLADMLRPAGVLSDSTVLRASVPVGAIRTRESGMIIVPLPVGVRDANERLRRIAGETSRRKQSPNEGVAGIVSMPASLAWLGTRWARHAAATHISLYVTNVPGPTLPLYLAGARLREVVPLAPLVAGIRLSVTALSYDGVLSVALLADEALDGFPAFAAGVRSALDANVAGFALTPDRAT